MEELHAMIRPRVPRPALVRRLAIDRRGLALIEFTLVLPVVVLMALGGAELAHYTTTRMRVSQIALHIADNAARMGDGPQMAAKTITETDVADIFTGGQLQSGELKLKENGRVILSDLEPLANPNTSNLYKIGWQRCYGNKAHPSTYGAAGDSNLAGIGPAGQQVTATDDNATMFVEVYYEYTPLVAGRYAPSTTMVETASMPVRDRRNLSSGIDNTAGAAVMSC
jgi:hypothetical protein